MTDNQQLNQNTRPLTKTAYDCRRFFIVKIYANKKKPTKLMMGFTQEPNRLVTTCCGVAIIAAKHG